MKRKTSKRMLTVSVFNIVWYTIAAIVLQFKVGVEISSTLTTCWYTFWTSEIFVLAGIRISKVIKYEDDDTEEVDENGMVG